jgi:tetratricopeptide (TPR) repeat protein
MTRTTILLLFIITIAGQLRAQDDKKEIQLYRYAVKLEQEGKNSEALTIYKNLLRSDSSNIDYLWRTSFVYSKLGYDQPTEEQRQQWYKTAAYLGKKAVVQFPQNANAHYAYAVAIGRMSENAGNRTKIDNAKLIKSEAELAIKLDPRLPGPYHIMGRWHRVVAAFSGFERAMIKAIFGGMPGGSYEDSILNFEKAIQLEPFNGIHYYEIAVSLLERNKTTDKQLAKSWLQKALNIPVKSTDDAENKAKCEKLLKSIT